MRRTRTVMLLLVLALCIVLVRGPLAFAQSQVAPPVLAPENHLSDPFATGWMLVDSNGDGLADAIHGKIVVTEDPTTAENAAAANFAARMGYGSTGLTLPLVVTGKSDSASGPHILIGHAVGPFSNDGKQIAAQFEKGEGGIFLSNGDLAIVGAEDAGLEAAAEAYSARAPFQWKVPGDRLAAIPGAINTAAHGNGAELIGLTYQHGQQGIRRAFVHADFAVTVADLTAAFAAGHLAAVREIVILGGASPVTATNPKFQASAPLPTAAGEESAPTPPANEATASVAAAATPDVGATPGAGAPGGGAAGASSARLDLATLYTSKGFFTGSAKMPIPSASDAHLYVPAGAAGIAMANLAARMGLETTGVTLPIASPAADATPKQVRTQTVLAGDSPLAQEAARKLSAGDTVAAQSAPVLASGEGELRVVDDSFEKHGAVLARGDVAGASAALDLLAGHFPNLWEAGKQYLSLEEIRYDLHRFFSLHSGAGQASAALYHLDRWASEIVGDPNASSKISNVSAEVYVELADPGLADFIRKELQQQLHVASVEVKTGSLHAGTQCCNKDPELHFEEPGYPFHQAAPTFSDDLVIPWEGNRLLKLVRGAAPRIRRGQSVTLVARVSEGPEERQKLAMQLTDILSRAGADRKHSRVEVLCAYKQGYSWLMDEIAPELGGKKAASIEIDFAKDVDATGVRAMYSPARWVQELYPVDEMLTKQLGVPLEKITLNEFTPPAAGGPTYRVRALNAAGKEILSRDFTVTTAMQPYNGVIPRYEEVQVDTGWVRLEAGSRKLLDERVETDPEVYWDYYQNKILPRIYHFVMVQAHGDLRPEFAPPFDTLKIDIHMSEPDYAIGLDKERISSLEALQEDTFYSTDTFINMMGDLETGRPINYIGRVIPIVHGSEDGRDGHVHFEFYGKPAANPVVRLSWTDAQGHSLQRERDLPVIGGEITPRLIAARVRAGQDGVENLTWSLPADYLKDDYEQWLNVEGQDQVDRSIFSVEQAEGELHWLAQMHASGLYRDDLAYPHLANMAVEFELPPALDAKQNTPAVRAYTTWTISAPATPRPMISDYAGKLTRTPIVQWDEPISPEENTEILARFAKSPGVNVYWMGRSYLGQDIWAADVMSPSPSALRSWAKETTLKAAIVYSGRQHANEVSSTSHIDKLGEELTSDPAVRVALKQVNVVLHPIDNPDGAQLSVELAKITPDNLLHPGYHGSLSADVSAGQSETDPVYPESRTRKQLIDAWLPDAFLNPHGYPSHEWVQPFSEYTGWVQSREGANPGRAWWIPRGWFTSLSYLRDPDHPESMGVTYALRDRIVEAERNVPGLLPLETRMNARYERFGQRWQPRDMFQPIVNGIRIYMALKGTVPARGPGVAPGSGGVGGISPDVTWDSAYTEAPDETAHGDYMKLMASAGLAFDKVHLTYLAQGKLRITRTEREVPGGVQWRIERARPILPDAGSSQSQP